MCKVLGITNCLEVTNDKVFEILTLSQTWLNDSISDSEIQMPGYSVK